MLNSSVNKLIFRNIGIDTYRENIIFLRADCHICQSEGFNALTRLVVRSNHRKIIATLNVVYSDILAPGEAGLSLEPIKRLAIKDGDFLHVTPMQPVTSMSYVRAKMYGETLTESALSEIIHDIVQGKYSNVEIAAFLAAGAGDHLSATEIRGLTKAMIQHGQQLHWHQTPVLDKHCVGGLPGNRTTPIVVSIIAEAGYLIPKTSSRAITSPAGTADTMEVFTNVDLDQEAVNLVIRQEMGCIIGGAEINISPADNVLITVERALDFDSDGQMIASVLSKKIAAGSTHIIIDIPVGPSAKIRSLPQAEKIKDIFEKVGLELGVKVKGIISDGSQPIGRGIGPALEAKDILAVLRNEPDAPHDLKTKSLLLAGALLELANPILEGQGYLKAQNILTSGKAFEKFKAICLAQGAFRVPPIASFQYEVKATREGVIKSVDSRKIARIAKLAGAPIDKAAGIFWLAPLGRNIVINDILFIIHAESRGELNYAVDFMLQNKDIVKIE